MMKIAEILKPPSIKNSEKRAKKISRFDSTDEPPNETKNATKPRHVGGLKKLIEFLRDERIQQVSAL